RVGEGDQAADAVGGRAGGRQKHLGRAAGIGGGAAAAGVEVHRAGARARHAGLWLLADGPARRLPQAGGDGRGGQARAAGVEPVTDEPYVALQTVMMPRDSNPYGNIFGGVIL